MPPAARIPLVVNNVVDSPRVRHLQRVSRPGLHGAHPADRGQMNPMKPALSRSWLRGRPIGEPLMNELGKALLGLGLLLAIIGALFCLLCVSDCRWGGCPATFLAKGRTFPFTSLSQPRSDQRCALGPSCILFRASGADRQIVNKVSEAPKRSDAARGRHQGTKIRFKAIYRRGPDLWEANPPRSRISQVSVLRPGKPETTRTRR